MAVYVYSAMFMRERASREELFPYEHKDSSNT